MTVVKSKPNHWRMKVVITRMAGHKDVHFLTNDPNAKEYIETNSNVSGDFPGLLITYNPSFYSGEVLIKAIESSDRKDIFISGNNSYSFFTNYSQALRDIEIKHGKKITLCCQVPGSSQSNDIEIQEVN